jgi:hypothetical protein
MKPRKIRLQLQRERPREMAIKNRTVGPLQENMEGPDLHPKQMVSLKNLFTNIFKSFHLLKFIVRYGREGGREAGREGGREEGHKNIVWIPIFTMHFYTALL